MFGYWDVVYGYDDCGLGCVYVNIGAWLVILESLEEGFVWQNLFLEVLRPWELEDKWFGSASVELGKSAKVWFRFPVSNM